MGDTHSLGDTESGQCENGKINAVDVKAFANNGGYSLDSTEAVMDRALFHMECLQNTKCLC